MRPARLARRSSASNVKDDEDGGPHDRVDGEVDHEGQRRIWRSGGNHHHRCAERYRRQCEGRSAESQDESRHVRRLRTARPLRRRSCRRPGARRPSVGGGFYGGGAGLGPSGSGPRRTATNHRMSTAARDPMASPARTERTNDQSPSVMPSAGPHGRSAWQPR